MTKYQVQKNQNRHITLKKPGEYKVELIGEGAEVEVVGAFVVGKGQSWMRKGITKSTKENEKHKIINCSGNCRVKVVIVHKAAHTRANMVLKGVVRDRGFLKFEGRIVIDKNCPDVNSFLTEKILLLSEGARAEAVPDLEIESDDVKCSHAATISRIPEEQVFYLRSRGLSKKSAEKLIVDGFLGTSDTVTQ